MTTPTATPVPSSNPADLLFNAEAFDRVVNATTSTFIDRFGNPRLTVKGATDSLNSAVATTEQLRQSVAQQMAAKLENLTLPELELLSGSTGASLIGHLQSSVANVLDHYGTVVRPEDFGDDWIAAANTLSVFGGTVQFAARTYPPPATVPALGYLSIDKLYLKGATRAWVSPTCDRLQNGTVLQGRTSVCANYFKATDIGFDLGKYVCDTFYSGHDTHSGDFPGGGTWDALQLIQPDQAAPHAATKGVYLENVIGLCHDSLSFGHGVLIENVSGGYVHNVVGVYGKHGVVIKSKNIDCGTLAGYMCSDEAVIAKSDTYAAGGNLTIQTVIAKRNIPDTTPWSDPANTSYGFLVNAATANIGAVQVGKIVSDGVQFPFGVSPNTGFVTTDVQIGSIQANTFSVMAKATAGEHRRIGIGSYVATNGGAVAVWDNSVADPLLIGSGHGVGITVYGFELLNSARVFIGGHRLEAPYAYKSSAAGKVLVGSIQFDGVREHYDAPVLSAGWSNRTGSASTFEARLEGNEVRLRGHLQNSGTAGVQVFTLPAHLRPTQDRRYLVQGRNVGSDVANLCSLTVLTNGQGFLNEAANTTGASDFVVLDGPSWSPL